MSSDEAAARLEYCRRHNIHHLLELLAAKVLVERPDNPFDYLRTLLTSVEESERVKGRYDATKIHYASDDDAAVTRTTATGAGNEAKTAAGALRKVTLGLFGLDNAGKTSVLAQLEGDTGSETVPTVGFTPAHFKTAEHDICIFDLGGAANFRGIWVHYFQDCHGIVYVIDSAAEADTVAQSLRVLRETLQHPFMKGKPLLVLANKKDLPTSRKEDVLPANFLDDVLESSSVPRLVIASCAIEQDEALETGMEWLLHEITTDYERLTARVQADSAAAKAEKERQRAARLEALRSEAVKATTEADK